MFTPQKDYDYQFKIITLGNRGVGKMSLLEKFCGFSLKGAPSSGPGPDFIISRVLVRDKVISLQIWPTFGMERYDYRDQFF